MTNESNPPKITLGENPEAAAERIREMMANLQEEAEKGKDECYDFTWVGKRMAKVEFAAPTDKVLRPDVEQSVNFDATENLFIAGDNLQALKLLQESYLGKVKMIYIDPPYNTGKDFVYHDNFRASNAEYAEKAGEIDEEGNRLVKNEKSNGRYHSDWLSMMYPRLKLARNLLSDDGVIFISIDDNEQANLKLLCDEVFGEENFISNICVKSRASVSNDKIISPNHNFILLYAKNQEKIFEKREFFGVEKSLMGFNLIDEKGKYKLVPVDGPGGAKKGNPYYTFLGVKGYWRFSKKTMEEKYKKGLIVRIANGLQQKYYKETAAESKQTVTSWWDNKFYTSEATRKLNELLGDGIFDTPKPIELIKRILQLSISNSPLILDFFAGSGTTAHAVMQLNAEDGGNRKWICVQLDEKCDEKSEAYKAGYKTIDEISRERIRRAAKQLCPQIPQANTKLFDVNNLRESADLGFRALKVDDDNFKAVRRPLGEIEQMSLAFDVDNIKKDRTPLDLLFGCLTAMALELNRPLKTRAIGETDIFLYDYADEGNGVVACFADSVPEEVAKEIAKLKPLTALFKDSSFATSVDKVNLYEHFRIVSPETKVRVI